MKFHTKFRPGDLVEDKETGDRGVIIEAQAIWHSEDEGMIYRGSTERKGRNETYVGGHYGVFPKDHVGSLNGYWYEDEDMELVEKGHLH